MTNSITVELRSRRSLLSVQEAASMIGGCTTTVRRYIHSRKLTAVNVGNRLRIDPVSMADFLDWVSSGGRLLHQMDESVVDGLSCRLAGVVRSRQVSKGCNQIRMA